MKSIEWDGEGVPPIGAVCEYRLNGGTWFRCKITYELAGTDDCFVAWCDHLGKEQFLTFSSIRYKLQLRKIKTPEQIAAEERLHAINEMSYLTQRTGSASMGCFRALYDAGYRKIDLDEHDESLHSEYTLEEVIGDIILPEWARWVAVDGDGEAYAFDKKPTAFTVYPVWDDGDSKCIHLRDLDEPANFKNCIWEIKNV